MGRMTQEDAQLQDAIIDQINAEIGAAGLSMKQVAAMLDRPYDSTRNYLRKERSMPLGVLIELCRVLDVSPDVLVSEAQGRLHR